MAQQMSSMDKNLILYNPRGLNIFFKRLYESLRSVTQYDIDINTQTMC